MKTQQDILHGRSLEEVAEAARAYQRSIEGIQTGRVLKVGY